MKILIAPDSFKDCLSAKKVALSLRKGMEGLLPGSSYLIAPMADGGEGTVDSVIDATGGHRVEKVVRDPLMRDVTAIYGITGDGTVAVIEMAAASGLELLEPGERDPWVTSTYGTGQLIRDAVDRGCTKILLGIGGSATNDGGAGMAEALGVRFFRGNEQIVRPGGGALADIGRISMECVDPRLGEVEIEVACDVSNPLTGPRGASMIYAAQKGADPGMAERLDRNLAHFAGIITEQLGRSVGELPGAGAAGGLGAGLMAFLNARLVNGFEMVARQVGLEAMIEKADLVITGEGKIDRQTGFGKTPAGVAGLAGRYGKPVIAVAGSLDAGLDELYELGFSLILSIQEKPVDLHYALEHAEELLERTGARIARIIRMTTMQD